MKQTKFTKAARGRDCQIRVPGVCNGNPETTVLAHLRMAGTRCGTGLKPHDLQAAWACSACHDAVDARRNTEFSREQLRTMHMEGMVRTIDILVSEGEGGSLNDPAMMFGGIPVIISEHLPTTKTIRWRTERKWCHWRSRPELRYRTNTKQVPCETLLMFNGKAVMSSASWAKIELELAARGFEAEFYMGKP